MQKSADQSIPERLLGVWAHPDDEAYLSAGLMADVIDHGGSVTLVVVTDGEGGFPAGDPRDPSARAALRRQEMRQAMARLGVSDIHFLGVPDGRVEEIDRQPLARRIGAVIDRVKPDMTVTFGPDGITGHADHIATGRATTLAWTARPHGRLLYASKSTAWLERWRDVNNELGIWMGDRDPVDATTPPALQLELSAADLTRKMAALAAHTSQTAPLVAAMGEILYRQWIAEETFRVPSARELGVLTVA